MSEFSIDKSLTIVLLLSTAVLIFLLGFWISTPAILEVTDAGGQSGKTHPSFELSKSRAMKNPRVTISNEAEQLQPDADWDGQDLGLEQFAEAAEIDISEASELKAAYFCDLAFKTRERCEKIPRNPEQMEFCLKASGYYTNSRHCGSQP